MLRLTSICWQRKGFPPPSILSVIVQRGSSHCASVHIFDDFNALYQVFGFKVHKLPTWWLFDARKVYSLNTGSFSKILTRQKSPQGSTTLSHDKWLSDSTFTFSHLKLAMLSRLKCENKTCLTSCSVLAFLYSTQGPAKPAGADESESSASSPVNTSDSSALEEKRWRRLRQSRQPVIPLLFSSTSIYSRVYLHRQAQLPSADWFCLSNESDRHRVQFN